MAKKMAKKTEMLKHEMLDKYLKKHDFTWGGDEDDLESKAKALEEHYLKATKARPEDQTVCTTCGFVSDVDEPECPFCGDADVEPELEGKTGGHAQAEKQKLVVTQKNKAKDKAKKGKKEADAAKEAEAAEEIAPIRAEIVHDRGDSDDDAELRGLAEERGIDTSQGGTELDLDEAVAAYKKAEARGAESYWDMGRALVGVCTRRIYMQRRDGNGNPVYKNWNQFCEVELEASGATIMRAVKVAMRFDRPTALALGISKATVLLGVPKDSAKLPQLIKDAQKLSKREFEEKVRPFVEQTPGTKARTSAATDAAREKREKDKADRAKLLESAISVALQPGRVTIPLFVKGSDEKRAKKLSDGPIGFEVSINGVKMTYQVVTGENACLELQITRRREE